MAISEDEGKLLAEASVNVMREFDITPDPKAEAIIGLIVAAGTVYGPRYYLVKTRHAEEKRTKGQAEPFKPSEADKTEAFDMSTFVPTVAPGFAH
jgi:hypothetical protein